MSHARWPSVGSVGWAFASWRTSDIGDRSSYRSCDGWFTSRTAPPALLYRGGSLSPASRVERVSTQ